MPFAPLDSAESRSWLRDALNLANTRRARRLASAVTVGAAAWEVGKKVYAKGSEKVTYQITLPSTDDTYESAHAWLVNNVPSSRRRALTVRSGKNSNDDEVSPYGSSRKRRKPRLHLYYDGSTAQKVSINGHRVQVKVEQEGLPGNVTLSASEQGWFRKLDQLVFTCYGEAARDAVLEFLQGLTEAAADRETSRLYLATRWGEWRRVFDLPARPLDTVVLRDGRIEALTEDFERFLGADKLYGRIGLPYHRGYLFHGPPGTGKTSLARALAEHFNLDVYFMPLSDMGDDTNLYSLVGSVDSRSMLVIEDVDIVHAAKVRDDSEKGISMSALLNGLDGMTTPHGLITVLTTNYLEMLDEALIRPGRVDHIEKLGFLDDEQAARLAELCADGQGKVLPTVKDLELTPATLLESVKGTLHDPEGSWWLLSACIQDARSRHMSALMSVDPLEATGVLT